MMGQGMNGLRDSARAIIADLVRKRLWPIAALLLVALVAVPLLLGASSSAPALPPGDGIVGAVPPPPASGAAADAATAPSREPTAKVRDPFFDPPAGTSDDEGASKQSAGAQSPRTATEKPAAKSSDAKPSSAAAKPPSKPATKPPRKPATKPPAAPAPAERPTARTGTYHVTAAWLAEGATTRPLARLTPIGNPATPAAVYLGVMKVGRPYAVFVLGGRTTSRGEAICAAETACRIIGLRPGDTQTITVHTADSRIAYVVHVSSVRQVTASAAHAGALRADLHPDGRAAIRALSRSAAVSAALRRVGYRRTTGLLFSQATDAVERATR